MDILPSCVSCGNPFTPRRHRQKYCPPCIQQSHTCVDCGAEKHRSVRGPRCRKCTDLLRIDDGKTGKWNRRVEKTIDQVVCEVESFGLLPDKQYAFGYVIGVVFGDGSISRVTNCIPHTRSDGTTATHDSTIYLIRLSVTSQTFAENFAKHLETLINKPVKVRSAIRTSFDKSTLKGRREGYSVQLFNIEKCHVLLGRYLAHLKYESSPTELMRFPLEAIRGFIHGMIDSEGYLNPKKPGCIDIANKDIKLLDTLVEMFALLGFKATVYTYPSQNVSHLVTRMIYTKYGQNNT